MKQNGWIKIYRDVLENPIVMKDSDHLAVWVWLLLHATSKKRAVMFGGKQRYLRPGELTTGRRVIASELRISQSKVQRVLKSFEDEHQIEQQTDRQCRLISIVNWDIYQVNNDFNKNTQKNKKNERKMNNEMNNGQPFNSVDAPVFFNSWDAGSEQRNEQQVNNDRTTSEQRVNTKQECKNGKNEREYTHAPSYEEVKEYVSQLGYSMDPAAFYDYYSETNWHKKNGQPIKDWKASVRTWERREKQYKQNGNDRTVIEPPKYKQFGPEPKIDAVEMPDNIRAAVNKILK